MAYTKGQHPGATWRKCDFQCHTPRDQGWLGDEDLPGGTPELEAARHSWATSFVAAAADKNLGVIAVTDHHDACFIPYVKQAAEATGLTLFPGVEVTCADNVARDYLTRLCRQVSIPAETSLGCVVGR
jgi:chromosome segregation protein